MPCRAVGLCQRRCISRGWHQVTGSFWRLPWLKVPNAGFFTRLAPARSAIASCGRSAMPKAAYSTRLTPDRRVISAFAWLDGAERGLVRAAGTNQAPSPGEPVSIAPNALDDAGDTDRRPKRNPRPAGRRSHKQSQACAVLGLCRAADGSTTFLPIPLPLPWRTHPYRHPPPRIPGQRVSGIRL